MQCGRLGLRVEQFRQRDPAEHAHQPLVHFRHRAFHGAGARVRAAPPRRRSVSVAWLHTVSRKPSSTVSSSSARLIAGGVAGQRVAALHAAVAGDESLLAQFFEDVRDERPAQAELLGDRAGGAAVLCWCRYDRISRA